MNANVNLANLAEFHQQSIVGHLGIEFLEATDAHLTARMPVDERTQQPFGILHGGASVVLAESLGSVASVLRIDTNTHRAVGLEINANHIRSVSSGWVYGKCTPIHLGRTTHVWDIRITDEAERLVCVSRLTIAIIAAR
ncbi:thioesterase superfamily protein [Fibrella aestuarina BUZ 2]|uniref:Thioesterase superfamily protein n=1 Tax=Fibrella aestuarina BUZ 2 TaxID=1166018 RepID=I0K576_9BACT|nr:hotdog fold thioesterase [Fibrella aestuarina]CCG99279.1 thioesterase superfamily protein [Fibrella aestuarina BUZ 2]